MRSNRIILNERESHLSWLYFAVFKTNFALLLVLCLLGSFLLQPFHKVLANESSTETAAAEVPAPVADDVKTQSTPESSLDTETPPEKPASSAEDTIVTIDEQDSDDQTESEVVETTEPLSQSDSETESASNVATASSTTTHSVPTSTSTASTAPQLASTTSTTSTTQTAATSSSQSSPASASDNSGVSSGSGNDQVVGSSTSTATSSTSETETVASGTEELTEDDEAELVVVNHSDDSDTDTGMEPVETVEPGLTLDGQYLVTDDNFYQFSRQSCVPVGNGTYHCSLSAELPVDQQSTVFSARDADGDMEIYLKTKRGEVEQLTDNELDDASPQLDVESMQIVWQRFIDGRYQIILYDLQRREERQLTFSRTNNMEPKVSGEGIVWQAWDGHDWEIMYFDGFYTDQLTDNIAQDVAPAIEDGYVLWSVLGKDQQEAMVYSLASGESVAITGHEGGMIENPRFVLVYDTKFDNGDVVTQGFDPTTGLSAPISAQPAQDPVDIPETDPTGEIRALIQNKSAQKEKEVVHTSPQTDTPGTDLNLASSTATSTDTLDIKQIQSDAAAEQPAVAATTSPAIDFELTEYDLVIVPTTTPSTTKTGLAAEVIVSTTSASSTQP